MSVLWPGGMIWVDAQQGLAQRTRGGPRYRVPRDSCTEEIAVVHLEKALSVLQEVTYAIPTSGVSGTYQHIWQGTCPAIRRVAPTMRRDNVTAKALCIKRLMEARRGR